MHRIGSRQRFLVTELLHSEFDHLELLFRGGLDDDQPGKIRLRERPLGPLAKCHGLHATEPAHTDPVAEVVAAAQTARISWTFE